MILKDFTIHPRQGAGVLRLDQEVADWSPILGAEPVKQETSDGTNFMWVDSDVSLIFDQSGAREMTIGPGQSELNWDGLYLFKGSMGKVHRQMCMLDGEPKHAVGYTLLAGLGLCLVDFYKNAGRESNRIISIWSEDIYSTSSLEFEPLDVSDW